MNSNLKDIAKEAGFKIFGDKIVAADNGSSGLATDCLDKFAKILINQILDIASPMPGSGDIDDLALLRVRHEVIEQFFKE